MEKNKCEKCDYENDIESEYCLRCHKVLKPIEEEEEEIPSSSCQCGREKPEDMPECLRCEKIRFDAQGDW